MKKNMLALLLLLACAPLQAQEVSTYTPGVNAEGVTYCLPRTVLDVTVKVRHVTETTGDFGKYASRYLRLNNVIEKDDQYNEIKDVTVQVTGLPDPAKVYTLKLDAKSPASNLQLTEEGIIKAINTTVAPVSKERETVAPQAARIDPKSYLTEEILSSGSKAKMAELTAKEIYAIRESRNAIMRGQADNMPKDGTSLKIVLDGLDKQEKALVSLFTGRKDTTEAVYTLRITPSDEGETAQTVLFRFSRKLGLLSATDLGGAPVYYSIKDQKTVARPDGKKKSKAPEGIVCNIPGKASVSIFTSKESLYEETLPLTQLGNVESLSSQLFGKKNNSTVIFDTATGAVLEISKKE